MTQTASITFSNTVRYAYIFCKVTYCLDYAALFSRHGNSFAVLYWI